MTADPYVRFVKSEYEVDCLDLNMWDEASAPPG